MSYKVPLKHFDYSNDSKDEILTTLFVVNLLITIGFTSFNTFLPLFLKEFDFSGTTIGILISAYSISKLFFSLFTGVLVDRVYKKRLMVILLLMFFTIPFLCFRLDNFYIAIFIRILQGIFFALFRPLLFSILCENICIDKSAKIVSSLDLSFYIATCAGPLLGGAVRETFGYYGLLILLISLTGISCLFFISTTKSIKHIQLEDEKIQLGNISQKSISPNLRGLCIFIMGKGCMISLLMTIAPIMLSNYGISVSKIGLIISLLSISMILFIKPAGSMSDYIGIYPVISIGSLIVSVLFFIIPNVNIAGISVVFVLIGIFSAISQPASSAALAYEGKKVGFGFASGIFYFFMNLGFIVGPLFGAYLMESFQLKYVFYFAGTVGIFSWIAFIATSTIDNNLNNNSAGEVICSK